MNPPPPLHESDVVLRDGSTIHLRPIRPDDAPRLQELHERLSRESAYFRFFTVSHRAADEARRLISLDEAGGFALVAEGGTRLCGVASYVRDAKQADRAEVSFAIADALQGRGIGTRMLDALASVARGARIRFFDAYVLRSNEQMMRLFLDCGFDVEQRLDGGVFHVVLSLEPTAAYDERLAERSRAAAAASMKWFFEPRGVVVIGANRERGHIGSEILHNLIEGGFTGQLHAVHPSASVVDGIPAFPTVTAVPPPVDLAIVAVPAARVLEVVDQCIEKNVKAIVVISAGFGETGAEGRAREQALLEKVRSAGIRMIGPNCMGIINTDPAFRLNATFSPTQPIAGRVAFSTQSGALGLAILDYVQQLHLGISTFVSVGNKADVSGNDLIQYWSSDPRTDVILLYLESFGNPRRFAQLARRVARTKPIVAVKAGRSQAGQRAAASHTGALATSDAVVDALFAYAGIIRTTTLEELFDVATLLANQPLPAGRRVAILTNAGGPGILAADACEGAGLELAGFADETIAQLRRFLPPAASVGNPVDMIASATADQYEQAARALLADRNVDSVIVIFIPPLVTRAQDVARAIARAAHDSPKTVLANFISTSGAPADLGSIPSYRFPEAAVSALARVARYSEWRRRPAGSTPPFTNINRPAIRSIVEQSLARGDGWLLPAEAQQVASEVGIAVAAARQAATLDEAIAAARDIGYPVALKAVGPEIVHKTEIGGVLLDIRDEQALRASFETLSARVGAAMTGVVVQQMVVGGVELLVGALIDPTFGPLVACGSGGVLVDLLRDTTFRIHPLTDVDAAELVASLRSAPLLRGYRGQAPADERALVDVLLRVSALLEICPEIQELDLNPLKVLPEGVRAVDIRVRVARPRPPVPSRRVTY